jgi:hypothetical protein
LVNTSLFAERQQQFLVFDRSEPRDVVLVEDQNHHQRGSQLRQSTGTRSGIELRAADASPIPSQKAVRQQDEDHLIGHQVKGREENFSRSEKHFS